MHGRWGGRSNPPLFIPVYPLYSASDEGCSTNYKIFFYKDNSWAWKHINDSIESMR